jgi:hypothetical protein
MKLHLNLASRVYPNRQVLYAIYTVAIVALTAVLILNLSQVRSMQAQSRKIQAYLAETERGLAAVPAEEEATPAARQRQMKEIAYANDILVRQGFRWTALLGRLEEVAVEGVSLRTIQPDYREGSLRITGLARGMEVLQRYLDRLIAAPHFSDVFLLQHHGAKIRDEQGREREAINFSLVLKGAF